MGIFLSELVDASSAIDDQYRRSSSRDYLVRASTDLDENQVRVALGFVLNGAHPSDSAQVCTGISVKLSTPMQAIYFNDADPTDVNIGSPCYVWVATITFGPWAPFDHSPDGTPANQPPSVRFEAVT